MDTPLKKLIEQVVRGTLRDLDEDLETREHFVQDLKDLGFANGGPSYNDLTIKGEREEEAQLNKIQRRKEGGMQYAQRYLRNKMKAYMKLGRPMKKLFHKYADHKWLKTLTLVHYVTGAKAVEDMLDIASKNELSAMAYLPGKLQGSTWGKYGVVLKGHITLLANDMDDLVSSVGAAYKKADPERARDSGVNKGVREIYQAHRYLEPLLVFDEEDWDPIARTEKNSHGVVLNYNNEALVDNWEPIAVIIGTEVEASGHSKLKVELESYFDNEGIDIPVYTYKEAKKVF